MPHFLRKIPAYADLRGAISQHALRLIDTQRDLMVRSAATNQPLRECSGAFSTTLGLPCAHYISKLCGKEPIGLGCIAQHWHLNYQHPGEDGQVRISELSSALDRLQEVSRSWPTAKRVIACALIDKLLAGQMPSLGDPAVVKSKGRSAGTKNKQMSSTKRDPSGFEHATKRRRHCSLCGEPNHNKRLCP